MQKIHILFFNQYISKSKAIKAISEKYNLFICNFGEQLRKQLMEEENELVIRIKSFMDNANLIPDHLMVEFFKNNIKRQNQDTLLIEFPKTTKQFLTLKKVLTDLDMEIQIIWHINQKNTEEYMIQYFKNPKAKLWLDKYGDEVREKWFQDFEKNQIFIAEMQKLTKNEKWKVIEVDYETEIDEELITKKINA
ncbi:nucleoside monophosphate kinase [Flavobacterium buctense]|uniref:Nucleoside monophosphate kinase n=1 Tax=Flavobacterium buctense TaxID=1648146 RepID=A0ABU9E6I8_9FLAO|nr:nucleoside monophosphate kinase [Flavobacterium buctense]